MGTITPAVILGGSTYAPHTKLGMVRSLGRLGIPVYVVERRDRYSPVFYSKYCAKSFVISTAASKARLLQELLTIARGIGRPSVLIPTSEDTAIFLADNQSQLKDQFIFPRVNPSIIHSLCNKRELYYEANARGICTPATVCPKSVVNLLDVARKFPFPAILKPVHGAGGSGQVFVRTAEDLQKKCRNLSEPEVAKFILQEYIPGGKEANWMFIGYFNHNSECLFGLTGKTLRIWPVTNGFTSLGVCLRNEVVEEATKKFMKAVGYWGLLATDWRFDARDGRYKILDINPRVGSEFRLFVSTTGMDSIRAFYLDLTDQIIEPGGYFKDRKWIAENLEALAAAAAIRNREKTVAQILDSYRGIRETGCFAKDDMVPGFHMFVFLPIRLLKTKVFEHKSRTYN